MSEVEINLPEVLVITLIEMKVFSLWSFDLSKFLSQIKFDQFLDFVFFLFSVLVNDESQDSQYGHALNRQSPTCKRFWANKIISHIKSLIGTKTLNNLIRVFSPKPFSFSSGKKPLFFIKILIDGALFAKDFSKTLSSIFVQLKTGMHKFADVNDTNPPLSETTD